MKKILLFMITIPFGIQCQEIEKVKNYTQKYIENLASTQNLKQSFIETFGVNKQYEFKNIIVGTPSQIKQLSIKKILNQKADEKFSLKDFISKSNTYKIPLSYQQKVTCYVIVTIDSCMSIDKIIYEDYRNGCEYIGTYVKLPSGINVDTDESGNFIEFLGNEVFSQFESKGYYIIGSKNKKFKKVLKEDFISYVREELSEFFSEEQINNIKNGKFID